MQPKPVCQQATPGAKADGLAAQRAAVVGVLVTSILSWHAQRTSPIAQPRRHTTKHHTNTNTEPTTQRDKLRISNNSTIRAVMDSGKLVCT